jgi:hypothetical protein
MTSKTLIILLTHNRPKILKRCISSSIKHSKIASNACWIIIDDSSSEQILKNSDVLTDFVNSGLEIIHITESKRLEIFQIISSHTSNNHYEIIFEKSYHRDISGFRNLGLFLNFILKSDLTFFIDDDMVINNDSSASEICFFDYVQKTYADSKNCIVGSTLMGILDESQFLNKTEILVIPIRIGILKKIHFGLIQNLLLKNTQLIQVPDCWVLN